MAKKKIPSKVSEQNDLDPDPDLWDHTRHQKRSILLLPPWPHVRYLLSTANLSLLSHERTQDGPVQGIKLELFIFDPFPLAAPGKAALMEVDRAAEFAPVKNAPGRRWALVAACWEGNGAALAGGGWEDTPRCSDSSLSEPPPFQR